MANSHRCLICGTIWESGDRFCAECGASLGLAQLTLVLDALGEPTIEAPSSPADPTSGSAIPRDDPMPPACGSTERSELADRSPEHLHDVVRSPDVRDVPRAGLDSPQSDESIERAFGRLAAAVASLPERSRWVLLQRFGLDLGNSRTLADVAQDLGVTRERIRQIERKAVQVLTHQRGAFVPAHEWVERLRQELGLSWRDHDLALALSKLQPQASWATQEHLRLLAVIFKGRTPSDEGIDGVDAAVVAIVARTGPLPLANLVQQVTPLLDPKDLARFPSFSLARRLELIGPARRRNDGRYDLPNGGIAGINDRRVRRLNAMIGVIERLGPSHYTTIARELDDHLPTEYRLGERDVHAWLGRYEDIFVWAGPGRFGLASHNVGIRAKHDTPEAALRHRVRSRRRRGIGDEIALLLSERGPLPMDAIADHILARFRVNPASVAAAVHQDSARRFTLTPERLVSLQPREND